VNFGNLQIFRCVPAFYLLFLCHIGSAWFVKI
jgi:hypothetical protein